jgi:hypothetical protein
VMWLKAAAVIASIDQLELRLQGKSLQVIFRGTRKGKFVNAPPHEIYVEGTCPLESN